MSLKLGFSHCLSPSYWSRWSLEGGAYCPDLYKCWRYTSEVLGGRILCLSDEVTVLIALPLSKCLALCSGMSCYYLWTRRRTRHTCKCSSEFSYFRIADSSYVEVMQYWTMYSTRGERLLSSLDFSSPNQDSRITTEVFNCSVYHCERGTRHFFWYASQIFWAKQDLPVSCPAL